MLIFVQKEYFVNYFLCKKLSFQQKCVVFLLKYNRIFLVFLNITRTWK